VGFKVVRGAIEGESLRVVFGYHPEELVGTVLPWWEHWWMPLPPPTWRLYGIGELAFENWDPAKPQCYRTVYGVENAEEMVARYKAHFKPLQNYCNGCYPDKHYCGTPV
jgi:hypothetical protein